MHKKRLRKKLGKRYKARAVSFSIAMASMQLCMLGHQTIANLSMIGATSFGNPRPIGKLAKRAAQAEITVNAYAAMPEIWKRVTNAKKLPVDWYYRKKMGYPPLEEV